SDGKERPRKPAGRRPPETRWLQRHVLLPGSWRAASGLLAQVLKRLPALHPCTVREFPGGIMLHARLDACRGLRGAGTGDAALHIGNLLKRGAEFFFLFGAVRTPERAVHLCAFGRKALREGDVSLLFMASSQVIRRGKRSHDQRGDAGLAQPRPIPG